MLTSYLQNNDHYSHNVHYFKFHFVLPQCLPSGNVIIWFILYHLVYSYFLNLEIFYTAHTHTHTGMHILAHDFIYMHYQIMKSNDISENFIAHHSAGSFHAMYLSHIYVSLPLFQISI